MASGGDIRAGKAFVELYVKNSALMKGLAEAQKRLRDFGNGISVVGKWMMGLGTAAIAPLALMAKRFESTGSALNDMSARTGVAVESLSEFSYAADQTGTNLETVESGVKKMQKAIGAATDGPLKDLQGMKPEDQFAAVARTLNAIEDPGERAAKAMEIFGKSGTALLPMIADLENLQANARRLGLVMSTEDAAAADAFGDALGDLKSVILNVGNGLIAKLAPSLTAFVEAAANATVQVKTWMTDNAELIATIFKIIAGVAVAGAGIFVFGKAIAGVGAIIGGFHSFILWAAGGLQMLVSVLGMAISPALLIGAALVAAGAGLVYLARNTAVVQAVGDAIAEFAAGVSEMVKTVASDAATAWDGITAALSAGDIGAAVKVVTTTAKLEWARLTTWLGETWQGFLSIWSGITNKIASFMLDAVAAIRSAWAGAMTTMANMWDTWTATLYSSPIYRAITTKAVGLVMGDDFAKQMDQVMQDEAKASPKRIEDRNAGLASERSGIEADRLGQQKALAQDKRASDDEKAKKIAAIQKELRDAEKARDSAVGAAKDAGASFASDNTRDSKKFRLPGLDGLEGLSKASASTVTFSASAAMGAGGSVQERIAKACERTFKFVGEQTTILRNIEKKQEPLVMKG